VAFPKFDPTKHPHGARGRFTATGGAAAIFGLGASKARLQLATKKPMLPGGAEGVRAALALAPRTSCTVAR
jgi:hypothetical protein